jgi:hypothetical protein
MDGVKVGVETPVVVGVGDTVRVVTSVGVVAEVSVGEGVGVGVGVLRE